MDVHNAYNKTRVILSEAGIEDAGLEAGLMIEHITGKPRFNVDEIEASQWEQLQQMAQRRAKHTPLQYLFGIWPFMDIPLQVGAGVLVPRPETETVCLEAAEKIKGTAAPAFLDLCAGSGALALGLCSLARGARGTAIELYDEAFAWLQKNIQAFGATHGNPPKAVQADVFTYQKQVAPQSLHLVVSNPPYVSAQEYAALAPELYHEPKQALVAEENGLQFYTAIAQNYHVALKPGGWLVFEIGAGQGEAVEKILREAGYKNVAIKQDLAGLDRIAEGQR